MARLEPEALADFPDDMDYEDPWEGFRVQEAALTALRERSDALEPGEVKGGLLQWQRGDGYAYYLVTRERPLTLTWVPFGDHWQVEEALIRGLRKQDVLEMLERERKLAAFFGARKRAGAIKKGKGNGNGNGEGEAG